MSRWPLALVLSAMLAGSAAPQQKPAGQLPPDEDAPQQEAQTPASKAPANIDLPPDEDASSAPAPKPAFNPVKSKKDVEIGTEYYKKGNYNAAAGRYEEATQYNDSNADAWLHLAEAQEKRNFTREARAAYERYLQLNPKARNAEEIRKRLEKLK
ncbi:MAG: tetratricopeptide repeat protein [Acidobacteriota bacterium]|nr:tetratricopeptide repeat protein [Acidobacteriota bacterium]